jgi:hypothetical protein
MPHSWQRSNHYLFYCLRFDAAGTSGAQTPWMLSESATTRLSQQIYEYDARYQYLYHYVHHVNIYCRNIQ